MWSSTFLDESGRPSFNILQNSSKSPILYYVFDVLVFAGREVVGMPLSARPDILDRHILSKLGGPIRESPELKAGLKDLVASVRAQGFEGLVAKRRDSRYEPGQRSGAWQKMRINKGQEFIIAGYTVGGATFDALIFGYYDESKLLYVGRTRNGFTPPLREDLLKRFRGLDIAEVSVRESPGGQRRALGARAHGGKDG
jgi:ATP-dependent DNA ligase